jgi:hypothetical protein
MFTQSLTNENSKAGFFNDEPQHDTFVQMQHAFAVTTMNAAKEPFSHRRGEDISLPTTYEFNGKARNLDSLLDRTHTSFIHD